MTSSQKISVVVVGLSFGAEFVPIYLDHPDVTSVAICDQDAARLGRVGDKFGITQRFGTLDEVIASDSIDAVTAANWTAAGICAHESAMHGGAAVEVPSFGVV